LFGLDKFKEPITPVLIDTKPRPTTNQSHTANTICSNNLHILLSFYIKC